MTDVSSEARQLWRDVLIEGVKASSGAHRPYDAYEAIFMADEMTKRFLERFEPDADSAAFEKVADEDRARTVEIRKESYNAQQAAREEQRRAVGPWRKGELLTYATNGESHDVEVAQRDNPSNEQVFVLIGGKKRWVSRADLTWREQEPAAEGEQEQTEEQPPTIGLVQ
jgi:hypothetical protein